MTTFGDLKARITTETNRDDLTDILSDQLAATIVRAVEHYATRRFAFNELLVNATLTTAGDKHVDVPSGLRTIDEIVLTAGGVGVALERRPLAELVDLSKASPTQGRPYCWAVYGALARLYPTPDQAYTLSWLGVGDLAPTPLSNDADSNAWTNEAQDLIAARTRFLLYRDVFKDADQAQISAGAEKEALDRLLAESAQRLGTGRVAPSW